MKRDDMLFERVFVCAVLFILYSIIVEKNICLFVYNTEIQVQHIHSINCGFKDIAKWIVNAVW